MPSDGHHSDLSDFSACTLVFGLKASPPEALGQATLGVGAPPDKRQP